MKTVSIFKDVEIYKEALKKIVAMMHDYPATLLHDPFDACKRIANEALDYVRGNRKPCVLMGCIHEGLETCRLHDVPVSGASWCEKYKRKE